MKPPPSTHYAMIHGHKTPCSIIEDFGDGWAQIAFRHPTLRGVVAKTIVAKTSLHPFGKAL